VLQKLVTRLLPKSTLKRAPSYGLIQVTEHETQLFTKNIAHFAKIFEFVIVLWPEGSSLPTIPSNVKVFSAGRSLTNRWQLIKHCSDGFVFPVSVRKPIELNHVTKLKSQLFAVGGTSAVGIFDFQGFVGDTVDSVDADFALVPMPEIDVDYAVIDQRFWKLSGEEFQGNEDSRNLAIQARKKGFGLFASKSVFPIENFTPAQPLIFSMEELAESALRNPFFLEKQNDESISFWLKFWNSMGLVELENPIEQKNLLLGLLNRGDNKRMMASPYLAGVAENELEGSEL
jgi:hypothetical protein